MKLVLYGDLQVNAAYPDYMTYVEKTLTYLLELIEAEKPDLVVNLGDTLDTFGVIDARSLLFAYDWMERIGKAAGRGRHVVLAGNHDLSEADGASVIQVFGSEYTIAVLRPELIYGAVGAVPFIRDPAENRRAFETLAGEAKVFVAHAEWRGVSLTPDRFSQDGMSPEELAGMSSAVCLNGHYHMPQWHAPVYCVGSPLYKDFRDARGSIARGFAVYDGGKIQQVANPHVYYVERVDAEDEDQLRQRMDAILSLGSPAKVKVFCPRELLPLAESYRDVCLWFSAHPTDTSLARAAHHRVDVDIATTPDKLVDAGVCLADQTYDVELLRSMGAEVFAP